MSNVINLQIENDFRQFYKNSGYKEIEPVGITSKVDKTVYLVNSATNLFKSILLEPEIQCFVMQPSMRTQILQDYYSKEAETEYPTCFKSFGAYASKEHVQKLIDDTIDFFSQIGFDLSKMRIRASYDDRLLLNAAKKSLIGNRVVLDERTEKYAHTYGGNITGRAIKLDYYQEWQNKHKNLCYFILISVDGKEAGVELATSDQLILMRLMNKQYAISVSNIVSILPVDTFEQRRLADCVVGTANLLYEKVRPNSSNNNGRTLKKYIKAINYFGKMLEISLNEIAEIISKYIDMEYAVQVDTINVLNILLNFK